MKFTGERVVFDQMNNNDGEVRVLQKHLERYVWALPFVRGKNVIDAACGTGYGTKILSFVTPEVCGMDIDKESINYATKNFHVAFICADITKDIALYLEQFASNGLDIDTVVSFETIEHLEHPELFLDAIKGKELIFSIPIDSPSEFHKHVYKSAYEIQVFIESFGWEITDKWLQDNKYFVGRAI